MQKIKTFMTPGFSERRANKTIEFINNSVAAGTDLLDIGCDNPIGKYIANKLELNYHNTDGDLDYDYIAPDKKFRIVFCLEVIEHLLSPKFFLMELKKYITLDTDMYISYPSRAQWLWTPYHFHEYDKVRFKYLLNLCGYEIVKHSKYKQKRKLKFGFRPIIRQFYSPQNLYLVRLKG